MAEKKCDNYRGPSCESGVGNLSVDAGPVYTMIGTDTGNVIRMRRMGERNTYLRLKLFFSAALHANTRMDVGYKSRDPDVVDDPDYFTPTGPIDVSGVTSISIFEGIAPLAFDHELTVSITTDEATNADKTFTLMSEFINASG